MGDHDTQVISEAEWKQICCDLQDYHAVFYKIAEIGRPAFRTDINTACVTFDKAGSFVNFFFNPKFWNECQYYEKLFVICHEALHILLNHGLRFKNPDEREIANVAMDIAVNHGLLDRFGFVRDQIRNNESLCWVDTVFPGEKQSNGWPIPADESSEFYFRMLKKKLKNKKPPQKQPWSPSSGGQKDDKKGAGQKADDQQGDDSDDQNDGDKQEGKKSKKPAKSPTYQTLDDHDSSFPTMEDISKESGDFTDVIKKLDSELSDDEKKEIEGFLKTHTPEQVAGHGAGTLWHIVPDEVLNARKNKKWESVITDWVRKALKKCVKPSSQWSRQNRRHTMLPKTFMLPSKMAVENMFMEKDKIALRFYFDVSYSCCYFWNRFVKAAMSIDPKKFDVTIVSFDTSVTEIAQKDLGNIQAGGGTYFHIIEEDIQNYKNTTGKPHPEAVWVLTDGYGTKVHPEKPENWYWFLTDGFKDYVPKKSKVFNLQDFE